MAWSDLRFSHDHTTKTRAAQNNSSNNVVCCGGFHLQRMITKSSQPAMLLYWRYHGSPRPCYTEKQAVVFSERGLTLIHYQSDAVRHYLVNIAQHLGAKEPHHFHKSWWRPKTEIKGEWILDLRWTGQHSLLRVEWRLVKLIPLPRPGSPFHINQANFNIRYGIFNPLDPGKMDIVCCKNRQLGRDIFWVFIAVYSSQ